LVLGVDSAAFVAILALVYPCLATQANTGA
jgi:hypothetical protein